MGLCNLVSGCCAGNRIPWPYLEEKAVQTLKPLSESSIQERSKCTVMNPEKQLLSLFWQVVGTFCQTFLPTKYQLNRMNRNSVVKSSAFLWHLIRIFVCYWLTDARLHGHFKSTVFRHGAVNGSWFRRVVRCGHHFSSLTSWLNADQLQTCRLFLSTQPGLDLICYLRGSWQIYTFHWRSLFGFPYPALLFWSTTSCSTGPQKVRSKHLSCGSQKPDKHIISIQIMQMTDLRLCLLCRTSVALPTLW